MLCIPSVTFRKKNQNRPLKVFAHQVKRDTVCYSLASSTFVNFKFQPCIYYPVWQTDNICNSTLKHCPKLQCLKSSVLMKKILLLFHEKWIPCSFFSTRNINKVCTWLLVFYRSYKGVIHFCPKYWWSQIVKYAIVQRNLECWGAHPFQQHCNVIENHTCSHLPSFWEWRAHYLACKFWCCCDPRFQLSAYARYELMARDVDCTRKWFEKKKRESIQNKMLDCLDSAESFDNILHLCNGRCVRLVVQPAALQATFQVELMLACHKGTGNSTRKFLGTEKKADSRITSLIYPWALPMGCI